MRVIARPAATVPTEKRQGRELAVTDGGTRLVLKIGRKGLILQVR